jgi:hypothetical protein
MASAAAAALAIRVLMVAAVSLAAYDVPAPSSAGV